jgi:hypothetical protein
MILDEDDHDFVFARDEPTMETFSRQKNICRLVSGM